MSRNKQTPIKLPSLFEDSSSMSSVVSTPLNTPKRNSQANKHTPFRSPTVKTPLRSPKTVRKESPLVKQYKKINSCVSRFFLSNIVFYGSIVCFILTIIPLITKIRANYGYVVINCAEDEEKHNGKCVKKDDIAFSKSELLRQIIIKDNIHTIEELQDKIMDIKLDTEQIKNSLAYIDDLEVFDNKIVLKLSTSVELISLLIICFISFTIFVISMTFHLTNQ